jgi:hypothetical protein
VLLVGVILLNPRVLEYDEIILAIPLTLIGWRFLRSLMTPRRAASGLFTVFVVVNVIAGRDWNVWKLTEGPLLVVFFGLGAWHLLRFGRGSEQLPSSPRYEIPQPFGKDLEKTLLQEFAVR